MLIVRCSTKLLKGLGIPDAPESASPESRLGEWYATVLQTRPHPVLLLVNEPSRLPVLVQVRAFTASGRKLADAILHVLVDLGVGAEALAHERLALADVAFARPSNRSITGSTNELAVELDLMRERSPHLADHAASLKLARMPIEIPGYGVQRPADVAMELLAG